MDIPFASAAVRKATRRLPFGGTFRFLNLALLAAVVGLGVAAYLTVSSSPAKANATIRTGTVSRGVVLSSVSATGSAVAPQDLAVDFATSGQLTAIDAKLGEKVTKGQVLGRLDQTAAAESVQEAEANLATAEASLATTRSGATASTKKQDSISMEQANAAVTQAKVGISQAQQTAAMDAKSQSMSVASVERQLRTDRGNEAAYVAAVKQDNTAIANDQTAYDTATAAVSADNGRIAGDKAGLEDLTNTKNSLTLDQTQDNQQLTADKATLAAQTTNSGKAQWQAVVDDDQSKVNNDAVDLQQNSNSQSTLSYQESQDETALTTDQQTQTAALSTLNSDKSKLTSDQGSITSYETKIVGDKQSLATEKLGQQSAALKDQQSVAAAKQQLSASKLSVRSTAVGNEVKEAPATASTLAQQEAAVLQAQAALTGAELTLSQTILRAPVSGSVAGVAGVEGQEMSAGGVSNAASSSSSSSGTSGSSPFVTLIGVTSMEATASFAESDAAKLKVGQASTVTIPALSNKELPAHVVAVDELGTSSSSVVQYTATVALDRNDAQLKPGMTANVSIVTAERDNVVTVPSSAVTGSGANATVKTVDAKGNQTTVRVVAGLVGDTTTEIVSGLKVGQQIVTSTVTAALTSTNSSSNFGGGGAGAVFGGGGGFTRRVGG